MTWKRAVQGKTLRILITYTAGRTRHKESLRHSSLSYIIDIYECILYYITLIFSYNYENRARAREIWKTPNCAPPAYLFKE